MEFCSDAENLVRENRLSFRRNEFIMIKTAGFDERGVYQGYTLLFSV